MRRWEQATLILVVMVLALAGCSAGESDDDRLDGAGASDPTTSLAAPTEPTGGTEGESADAGADVTADSEPDPDSGTEPTDSEPDPDPVEDGPAVVLRRDGIDEEYLDALRAVEGVEWVAPVEAGQVHLTASSARSGKTVDALAPGFVIQLEAVAHPNVDAARRYAPELAEALALLGDQELVLSESSAEIRRLNVGSTIIFDRATPAAHDGPFRVAAILPDSIVGTAEVVFAGSGALAEAGAGQGVRQVAFVGYGGTGPELEQELLAANGGTGVRVFGGRGNGDGDRLRTTLPAIEVKKIFGEFAFRPIGSSAIEIDRAWSAANLVIADLPLLGQARCHRVFAEILTEVLQGLIDDGLADVIDPSGFQGCWNPRRIAGADRLSKHAWGMAADINFGNPLDGSPGSPVHPELLDRMLALDVISGHLWTASPDPGHFEYRGPAEP